MGDNDYETLMKEISHQLSLGITRLDPVIIQPMEETEVSLMYMVLG